MKIAMNAAAEKNCAPRRPQSEEGPAIFLSPDQTYHADRCEPLMGAVSRGEVRLTALARRGYPGRLLPDQMMPEVSTVGVWDATGPQTWGLDWHRNEGVEFTFLSGGRTDFYVEENHYPLTAGQLTITRPWQRHKLGSPAVGPSRLHWFILDVGVRRPNQPWRWPDWLVLAPADCEQLSTLLSHNETPVWPANAEIGASFERIARLIQNAEPAVIRSRLQLCINEILLAVLELLQKKVVALDARLVSTRRTVEMFLAALPEHVEHPWTLDEMAGNCGLGRSRFADYCRQITNVTPAEYLTRCRVEAARKMLATPGSGSITDIALACGFQSSQYFSTVFRQKTGMTPREIREARQAG
jgi:AraC family L-rhamnose operon regulatory protein RhaS